MVVRATRRIMVVGVDGAIRPFKGRMVELRGRDWTDLRRQNLRCLARMGVAITAALSREISGPSYIARFFKSMDISGIDFSLDPIAEVRVLNSLYRTWYKSETRNNPDEIGIRAEDWFRQRPPKAEEQAALGGAKCVLDLGAWYYEKQKGRI
jgi:hypothetical protein